MSCFRGALKRLSWCRKEGTKKASNSWHMRWVTPLTRSAVSKQSRGHKKGQLISWPFLDALYAV